MLLDVDKITKRFGGVTALRAVSISVEQGQIIGLIGPNGSGKTTLINVITGVLRPDEGNVYFKGEKITGRKPHSTVSVGIGRTFQLSRVFANLTVLENMFCVARHHLDKDQHKKALDLLTQVNLIDLKNNLAMDLSFGQQRLLEFARTLMYEPTLLLLDEPTAGINPVLAENLAASIGNLSEDGKTFMIVEHNIPFVRRVCERLLVLNEGEKVAEGSPEEVLRDKRVIDAYLGGT